MIETAPLSAIAQHTARPECPVCLHSDATRFAFARNGTRIYSCRACGLEFQYPQPTDRRLAEIYSSEYFLGSKDQQSLANQKSLKRATASLYLNHLAPFLRQPHPRLLEIGCGHGEFLLEAQRRGYRVEGIEYSRHAATEANSRLGQDLVRVGSPEADVLPPAAYDVIGAFDVIEHLRNPSRSLAYMHAALKPGGLIAIVTPSLDSWSRRLLGRYWMEYKTEHLTYFSRKSLARLLTNTGFTGISFLPNYKTLNLEYVTAHFERFPVPLLTPIVRLMYQILPAVLAHRPVRIVASGVMAIARKQS